MSLSPSTDLKISFEEYEEDENYGLTKRSIRPGKTPLDVVHCESDDEIDELPPDARAELQLESYRRKLGCAKREARKWSDEQTDEDAVECEISTIIRNTGSDRQPANYRLNSKTTSRAAMPVDKFPVAGVKGCFLTPDHFKFSNPYFSSKPEEESSEEKAVRESRKDECPSTNTKSYAHLKSFKEPTTGVPGEQYVSPAQLYFIKGRRNR